MNLPGFVVSIVCNSPSIGFFIVQRIVQSLLTKLIVAHVFDHTITNPDVMIREGTVFVTNDYTRFRQISHHSPVEFRIDTDDTEPSEDPNHFQLWSHSPEETADKIADKILHICRFGTDKVPLMCD